MRGDLFDHLKSEVTVKSSAAQILELEELIETISAERMTEIALERRTRVMIRGRTCPRCASHDVVLHGRDHNGRQRFRCRGCGRRYNILTGTPMARARKPEKWRAYLGFMTRHVPVRKIVEAGIGVHHVTVWRWRHRFLAAAATDQTAMLSGVIESEKTYFPRSFKGERRGTGDNRPAAPARHRPASATGPDPLTDHPVAVLTALDNSDHVFQTITPSARGNSDVLDGRIAPGSVLCVSGSAFYVARADEAGSACRAPDQSENASAQAPVKLIWNRLFGLGRLRLERVRGFHATLKDLVFRQCLGVATKYLANYLGWHRAIRQQGFQGSTLLHRALGL